MKTIVVLSLLALLAVVPSAEATCHYCLEAVVDSCTAADVGGCAGNSVHLALHAPEFALYLAEVVREAACVGPGC